MKYKLTDVIKIFLFERSMTMTRLSNKINTSLTYICSILSGKLSCSISKRDKICKVLDISEKVIDLIQYGTNNELIEVLKKEAPKYYIVQNMVFTPIPGFKYFGISQTGVIKNLQKDTILKTHIGRQDFICVGLYKNSVYEKAFDRVHRLLALTFIPNPNNYQDVIFKDNDKNNLELNNLYWANRSQTIYHTSNIARGSRVGISKLNDEKVRQIRELRSAGLKVIELAYMYNVSSHTISNVIYGKTWKHVV